MFVIKIVRVCFYPLRFIFGSGIGNIRLLKWLFTKMVNLIPPRFIILDANGCKLGMTIGRGRGFDSMASGLVFGKGYEVGTTKLFFKLVKSGMNVVDIGAHIGYYTVLASRLVGENGKVWAFEPEPRNFSELQKNVCLNNDNNVVYFKSAVGDTFKTSSLFYSTKWSGECSLVDIKQRPKDSISVEVVSLDEALKDRKIDVIKMDVDGGEIMVLDGARKLIEQSPNLVMFAECWKYGLEGANHTLGDYWNKLKGLFKYIYQIDEHNGSVKLLTLEKLTDILTKVDGINILCSKKELWK
jgi:FkbM family methyltransferase